MKSDNHIVLDKLYEIIEAVEQLDSSVDKVSHMVIEKLCSLCNAGDKVLENLSIVGDGIAMCIAGMDRVISRMNRLL